MATEPKTTAQILAEKLAETGKIELTAPEANELRSMVRQIKEFLSAMKVAGECRSSDPINQRICEPCWANMATTAKAIDPTIIEVLPV